MQVSFFGFAYDRDGGPVGSFHKPLTREDMFDSFIAKVTTVDDQASKSAGRQDG